MVIFLTIIHVIVCVFLILVVLLQSGKAADIAGAFGGMGSQTTFGPRGAATALSKATTIAAGLFMITSLTLSVLQTRQGAGSGSSTVLENVQSPAPAQKQGAPAGKAPVTAPSQVPVGTTPAPVAPAQSQPAPAKK